MKISILNKKLLRICFLLVCLLFVASGMKAQSVKPGNVSSTVELWLNNPDEISPLPAQGASVSTWQDKSGNSRHFTQRLTQPVPKFDSATKVMNFHPALSFAVSPYATKLALQQDLVQAGKAHYVFYVSELTSASAKIDGSVVLAFNASIGLVASTNNVGWAPWTASTISKPYFQIATTAYTHQGNGKQYGIIGVELPNTATNNPLAFINGIRNTATFAGKVLTPMATNPLAIVGSTGDTQSPFIGNLQEIIVLTATAGTVLSDLDFQKINSYLALKYGITFEEYNYRNSNGNIVWDKSINNGYNNHIFGLVRDDLSGGLHQKQARSYSSGNLTAFLPGPSTLQALNVQNTNNFPTDKTYILFGSNGQSGTTVYDPIYGGNPALLDNADINQRTKEVFKVQMHSGPDPLVNYNVNLQVADSAATYILVSTSPQFAYTDPSTKAYKITDHVAQNVPLHDGDYVSYTLGSGAGPGGIFNGIELWLKADDASLTALGDGGKVTTWADKSGSRRDFAQTTATYQPVYARNANVMNFQPSVFFNNSRSATTYIRLEGPVNFLQANHSYHVFYVSQQNSGSTFYETVLDFDATGIDHTHGWNIGGKPGFSLNTTTPVSHPGNGNLYGINLAMHPNNTTTPHRFLINGGNSATFSASAYQGLGVGKLVVGTRGGVSPSYSFQGYVQEIIVLSDVQGAYLPDAEVVKANSYLALKYGISLETGDYRDTYGNVVWKRSLNSGYTNHIFGLARDNNSSLYVKQATSYSGKALSAYVEDTQTPLPALNIENTGTLANNTYLVFGSNGLTGVGSYQQPAGVTFKNHLPVTYQLFYRLNEAYKVQLTGQSSLNVKLKTPDSDADLLLVSSSPNFEPALTDAYDVNVADGTVGSVKIETGNYITYAIKSKSGSPPDYKPELWLNADFFTTSGDTALWPDYSGSLPPRVFTNYGYKQLLPFFNTSRDLMNYHPSVRFGDSSYLASSSGTAFTDIAKSYYLFYVSEYTGNKETAVVLSMNGGTNYNGWSNTNPFFTSSNTEKRLFTQSEPQKYGITAVMRPNDGVTPQSIYFNGAWINKDTTPMSTSTPSSSFLRLGGTDINLAGPSITNTFVGNLQELIVVSPPSRGKIDMLMAQKLNTYLAIKYGITLDAGDYLPALYFPLPPLFPQPTVIWSRSLAHYQGSDYKYGIFGIARDDGLVPPLDQEQSRGYAPPYNAPFTVFVGDLKPLARDNVGHLTNNTSIMFSTDTKDIFSIRPLKVAIPAGTLYTNDLFPINANYSTAIYMIQQSGSIPLVKIRHELDHENCYLLVSSTPGFEATATRWLSFDADRTVALTFASDEKFLRIVTKADEAPGGIIEGLHMWLRADTNIVASSDGDIDSWTDVSKYEVLYNNANKTTAASGSPYADIYKYFDKRPLAEPASPTMNYHEAVNFREKGEYLTTVNFPMPPVPAGYTFFTMINADFDRTTTGNNNIYYASFGTHQIATTEAAAAAVVKPGLGITKHTTASLNINTVRYRDGVNFIDNGNINLFKANSATIVVHEVKKAESVAFEVDAYREVFLAPTKAGLNSFPDGANKGKGTLGDGVFYTPTERRNVVGRIGEVMAYDRVLTNSEKDAIYSYLGLKYGVTIDKDKTSEAINFDYKLSDGTVVWPGNTSDIHRKYHYDVAALVRDDGARYSNLQSRSTGVDHTIWMGIKNASGDLVGFGADQDKSALVWGHDSISIDNTIIFSEDNPVCGPATARLKRVWLVDNNVWRLADPNDATSERIFAPQRVTIRVGESGSSFPYGGSQWQVYMLIADSEDDLFRGNNEDGSDAVNNWTQTIPGTYVDGEYQFEYTFDKDYTYVTFGIRQILCPTCDACAFDGNKTLSFSTTNWTTATPADRLGPKHFDLGSGFGVDMKVNYENGCVSYNNAYPVASSLNSLALGRGGSYKGTMTTTIATSVSATASFDILDIDYFNGVHDNVEIWGTSGTPGDRHKYYPKLSYATDQSLCTYEIRPEGKATALTGRYTTYTNPVGTMHVRFDSAVDSIYIRSSITGTQSLNAYSDIGIAPITFSCPIVMPIIDESGLSLLKEAPDTILLCKEVTFVYRIYNANCDPKLVNFNDTLPTGLSWIPNSLSVDAASQSGTYAVNTYGGRKELNIKDLIALGGTTTTFTIKAIFDDNALAGTYDTGYADITYKYFKEGVEVDGALQSCDRFLGCGSPTIIEATGSPADRYKPIIASISSKDCFSPNEVLTFKINVSNINATTFSNVALNIELTDSLTLAGSFDSDLTLGTYTQNSLISHSFAGISLPINVPITDPHWITFKVKVPAKAGLKHVWVDSGTVDADGNPIFVETDEIEDLAVSFEFRSESPDECQQEAFKNANGIKELPLCGSKFNIIINKNITVPKKRL